MREEEWRRASHTHGSGDKAGLWIEKCDITANGENPLTENQNAIKGGTVQHKEKKSE